MDSRIREDIVDRGIERGEWEMRNLSKQLGYEDAGQPHATKSHVGTADDHNAGQISADGSGQTGTPVTSSKDEDSSRHEIDKDDIRDRKVDPEAVRESFKEAELDPVVENEPEEGEKAA